jgi:hypothetical protein
MTGLARFPRGRHAIASVLTLVGLVSTSVAVSGQATPHPYPGNDGPSQLHGTVGYVAPPGWTAQRMPDGTTVLAGTVNPEDRPCEIRMLPLMQAQNDLATQGASLVQAISVANRLGPYLSGRRGDVRDTREEGTSAAGWNYVDLSGQLGQSGITVRALMIQMGSQVLPILGFSKTWKCLGNQSVRDNDVWALFFHSLQVPGSTPDSAHLAQQLVGMWSSASGGAGVSLIFAPNGHFASVAVYQSYALSSTNGMVWEIDRSWKGDGPYSLHGDVLHTENPHGSDVEKNATRYFSIVREPNDNKPGGFQYALLLVERSWDGSATWGFSPSGNFVLHMVKSGGDSH